jgi:hypothetical protein
LWAPKGTPKAVIDKLNTAVVEALSDPTARQRLADLAEEIPAREQQTPEALAAHQKPKSKSGGPSSRPRVSRATDAEAIAAGVLVISVPVLSGFADNVTTSRFL